MPDRDADAIGDARDNCPDTPNPGQRDADVDDFGNECDISDASPGPALGRKVVLRILRGVVRVRPPGASRFRPLQGAELVRVGTVVDATDGRLRLTSAASARTRQSFVFDLGVFRIAQVKARRPTTDIRLAGAARAKVCGSGAASAVGAAARSKRRVSRLRGKGKGRVRVITGDSVASSLGTEWVTELRCDGTLTRVRAGTVRVVDRHTGKRVIVRARRSYLAHS